MDTLDKIFLHQIAIPGLPGGITAAEAAAIRSDQAAILDLPRITGLDAVPDVNAPAPAEGQALVYDAASGTWLAETIVGGVMVWNGSDWLGPFPRLNPLAPFAVETDPDQPEMVKLGLTFAGTGKTGFPAHSDHWHTVHPVYVQPFEASGSLSSGTRTLGPVLGIHGLDPAIDYQVSAALRGDLRGEGSGAGRSHPRITINGDTRFRFGGSRGYVRTVSGVDREYTMEHPGFYLTNQSSVTISAAIAHVDGDPKYIGGAELTVRLVANR